MRDPLQARSTPYEVLGISGKAGKAEVDAAFKEALKNSRNPKEVTEAWQTLKKPVERGMVDVFLYRKPFVDELTPGLWGSGPFLLEKRGEVFNEWRSIRKSRFPHSPVTHSLALLAYYWALYLEEEKLAGLKGKPWEKKTGLSGGPHLEELWEEVVAGWAHLIVSDAFWKDWIIAGQGTRDYVRGDADILALRQRIENHFVNLFHSYREKYRAAGDDSSTERLGKQALQWATEVKTARRLQAIGLQIARGGKSFVVSCGQLMLGKLGYLGTIRKQLAELARARPQDKKLQELAASLSAYADIAVLVENKKFAEAIRAVEGLPQEERQGVEVQRLLARALLEKGKQDFSLNRFDEAMESWKQGLETGQLKKEIEETLVSLFKAKAGSLQKGDPEEAIALLQKALKVISSKELELILAEILAQRGIQLVVEVQKKLETAKVKKITSTMIRKIEKGVRYLEKGKKLGSKRAAENLPTARNFLAQAKSGMLGLDPEVGRLIQQAQKEAEASRWDRAIDLLLKAKSKAGEAVHKTLDKMLSQFYNARAVKAINSVMGAIGPMMKKYQELVPLLIDQFITGKALPPDVFDGFMKTLGPNLPRSVKTAPAAKKKSKVSWFIPVFILGAGIAAVLLFGGKVKVFLNSSDPLGKVIKTVLYIVLLLIIFSPFISAFFQWIGEKLKEFTKPLVLPPTGYGYDNRPPCFKCSEKASYSFNLAKYGTVNLCSTHADMLKALTSFKPSLTTGQKARLKAAETDLGKALELDPGLVVAKKNLQEVRQICRQFNVV